MRIFLVGNGPSLNAVDLERLNGEVSWGMARIHLLYDRTDWRPNAWWFSDIITQDYQVDDILFHLKQGYKCYIRSDVVELLEGRWQTGPTGRALKSGKLPIEIPDHVYSWPYCVHHNAGMIQDAKRPKGWHLGYDKEEGVGYYDPDNWTLCKYGSGMNAMLQQAFLEGFNPVYILGCDLGFKYREGSPGEPAGPDPDHFSEDYNPVWQSDTWVAQREPTHIDFHKMAYEYLIGKGIEVYNAGIGGNLEVYPRVDFESICPG
jgi:hypothetical protein